MPGHQIRHMSGNLGQNEQIQKYEPFVSGLLPGVYFCIDNCCLLVSGSHIQLPRAQSHPR